MANGNDGPLDLSHGDVLCVVVPVEAECIDLSLYFMGEGDEVGVEEGREVSGGTEDGASLVSEDILDLTPD